MKPSKDLILHFSFCFMAKKPITKYGPVLHSVEESYFQQPFRDLEISGALSIEEWDL